MLAPASGGRVHDVNRFGDAGPALAGAAVTISIGSVVVDTATTAADGAFSFDDPGVDPATLYDLTVTRDSVARRYDAIRPKDFDAVLPLALNVRADKALDTLAATPALVLAYDTRTARATLAAWNDGTARDTATFHARDHALARLTMASEGLAEIYKDTEPLAFEAAGITVKAVTTALATKKVMDDMVADAAISISKATGTQAEASLAFQMLLKASEIGGGLLQSTVKDALGGTLPEWASTLYDAAVSSAQKGVLGALESSRWDNEDGRKALLQEVVTQVATEAGKRVVASAYVAATQEDLDAAAAKAQAGQGEGEVGDAFTSLRAKVVETTTGIDDALSASQGFGDTADKWNTVAEVSMLVGKIPGAQIAAALGTIIRAVSAGIFIGTMVDDYYALYETAEEDVPDVVSRAFVPVADEPEGAPAGPTLATAARIAAAARAERIDESYSVILDTLGQRLRDGDRAGALESAGALLAAEDSLTRASDDALPPLVGAAETARTERPDFEAAYLDAIEAAGDLASQRMALMSALAAYVVPALATPNEDAGAPADTLALADSVLTHLSGVETALSEFEQGVEAASDLVDGLEVPALVLIAGQRVDADTIRVGQPFRVSARAVNAGAEAAEGVVVRLVPEDTASAEPVLRLRSEKTLSVGTLESGAGADLSWDLVAEDTSAAGAVGSYRLEVRATSGRVRDASGVIGVAGAGSGVGVEEAPGLPGPPPVYTLEQSYPNPFSRETTIEFALPEGAQVRLAVYDVLGREVAVLVDTPQPAGTHRVVLDGTGLPSGVYVYRMQAGAFTASRRMVLVR